MRQDIFDELRGSLQEARALSQSSDVAAAQPSEDVSRILRAPWTPSLQDPQTMTERELDAEIFHAIFGFRPESLAEDDYVFTNQREYLIETGSLYFHQRGRGDVAVPRFSEVHEEAIFLLDAFITGKHFWQIQSHETRPGSPYNCDILDQSTGSVWNAEGITLPLAVARAFLKYARDRKP